MGLSCMRSSHVLHRDGRFRRLKSWPGLDRELVRMQHFGNSMEFDRQLSELHSFPKFACWAFFVVVVVKLCSSVCLNFKHVYHIMLEHTTKRRRHRPACQFEFIFYEKV